MGTESAWRRGGLLLAADEPPSSGNEHWPEGRGCGCTRCRVSTAAEQLGSEVARSGPCNAGLLGVDTAEVIERADIGEGVCDEVRLLARRAPLPVVLPLRGSSGLSARRLGLALAQGTVVGAQAGAMVFVFGTMIAEAAGDSLSSPVDVSTLTTPAHSLRQTGRPHWSGPAY